MGRPEVILISKLCLIFEPRGFPVGPCQVSAQNTRQNKSTALDLFAPDKETAARPAGCQAAGNLPQIKCN